MGRQKWNTQLASLWLPWHPQLQNYYQSKPQLNSHKKLYNQHNARPCHVCVRTRHMDKTVKFSHLQSNYLFLSKTAAMLENFPGNTKHFSPLESQVKWKYCTLGCIKLQAVISTNLTNIFRRSIPFIRINALVPYKPFCYLNTS